MLGGLWEGIGNIPDLTFPLSAHLPTNHLDHCSLPSSLAQHRALSMLGNLGILSKCKEKQMLFEGPS